MKHKFTKKLLSALTAVAVMLSIILINPDEKILINTEALSVDYAPQLMNIAVKNNSKVLTENGTSDGSSLSAKALGNNLSASWRFDRVGKDSKGTFFKIVNAESGRLLTPQNYNVTSGASVIVYGSESAQSQHWYAVPVKNDRLGNNLYYKIVNYSDTSLALTQGTSGMTLSSYSGADNQLWLLNSDGLQGFAGYCFDDNTGNIKASDIGGLFGEVVEVSTFADLKKYATSDEPYTIVVNKNISVTELNMNGTRYMCTAGRIYVHDNKTIIGSYSAHTLFNVQFCTSSSSGTGNNIIIKNFDMQHDSESNNNDSIVCYFSSGENIWVDHVTFTGHENYGYASSGLVDEDKFLACCYDADYCTVSDCSFGGHKYGLILGYPNDNETSYNNYNNYPRMSIIGNKFNDTSTRGPGLMRWGYFHSLNNYVNKFSMAYTVISDCKIFAENCVYENGGNVICDWDKMTYVGAYSESGSTFSGCNRTQQGGDSNSTAKACSWRPTSNYSYVSLTAANAKTYCNSYTGCQSSNGNMMYLRFSGKGVPTSSYVETPNAPIPVSFNAAAAYQIKNANSGLYLDVAGGEAKNNANIQQWGSSEAAVQNTWRFVDSGDGYYYIQSMVGDKTFVMDLEGGKTANGTNIGIYGFRANDNQKFIITQNSDGTYKISPKAAEGSQYVEIASASTASGANCQTWENTGSSCQNWILEEVELPGETMDTSVNYMFKNASSGLYMEVADGSDKDGANVQQWAANGEGENNSGDWNSWTLKNATGDLYYIISNLAGKRYLTVNSDNIEISARDSSSNVQMMKFVKNPDGTYSIYTRTSYNKTTGRYTKAIEVENASSSSGANVRQWDINVAACQNWNAETFKITTPIVTTTTTTTSTTTTTQTTTVTTAVTTDKPIETTAPTETKPTPIIGDINGDGKTEIADIILLKKYLINEDSFTSSQSLAADLNKDNKINIFDFIILKNLISG